MSPVEVERHGRITVVSIHREHKRNAVSAEVTAGIDAAFNEFEDDPDQWVAILTGTGDLFSAGTDLIEGPGERTARGGDYGLIRRARAKPLIAAVEGIAFGGGFELAMAADMVVAGDGARFALPEVRRGVIATSGALFRAARLLPPNLAKELLLTGEEISAARAAEIGFVNRVVPAGTALAAALELAETIAANAPVSVQETLGAVDAMLAADDARAWSITEGAIRAVMASEDLAEGLAAFAEKRDPVWKGR